MSNYYVYLRNPNSGEVHRVVEDGKTRFVDERCNLDDTKNLDAFVDEDEATEYVEEAAGSWCGHCCAGLIAEKVELTATDVGSVDDILTFPGDAAETAADP